MTERLSDEGRAALDAARDQRHLTPEERDVMMRAQRRSSKLIAPTSTPPVDILARLEALEARVTELEKWKGGASALLRSSTI